MILGIGCQSSQPHFPRQPGVRPVQSTGTDSVTFSGVKTVSALAAVFAALTGCAATAFSTETPPSGDRPDAAVTDAAVKDTPIVEDVPPKQDTLITQSDVPGDTPSDTPAEDVPPTPVVFRPAGSVHCPDGEESWSELITEERSQLPSRVVIGCIGRRTPFNRDSYSAAKADVFSNLRPRDACLSNERFVRYRVEDSTGGRQAERCLNLDEIVPTRSPFITALRRRLGDGVNLTTLEAHCDNGHSVVDGNANNCGDGMSQWVWCTPDRIPLPVDRMPRNCPDAGVNTCLTSVAHTTDNLPTERFDACLPLGVSYTRHVSRP